MPAPYQITGLFLTDRGTRIVRHSGGAAGAGHQRGASGRCAGVGRGEGRWPGGASGGAHGGHRRRRRLDGPRHRPGGCGRLTVEVFPRATVSEMHGEHHSARVDVPVPPPLSRERRPVIAFCSGLHCSVRVTLCVIRWCMHAQHGRFAGAFDRWCGTFPCNGDWHSWLPVAGDCDPAAPLVCCPSPLCRPHPRRVVVTARAAGRVAAARSTLLVSAGLLMTAQ